MEPWCRHCGRPIVRYYAAYTNGWVHRDGTAWCRTTMATPEGDENEASVTG